MDLKIQISIHADFENIVKLLETNKLPTSDIYQNNTQFFVAIIDNNLAGTIGIEQYNQVGLLRSLAVKDEFKNHGIGEKLVQKLFEYSKLNQITELYLLTTTADKYFLKFGFEKIDRQEVPEIIRQTSEFKDICPQSAVVMRKMVVY